MRSHFLIVALLVALNFFAFWQVRDFGFVNFDDPVMVSQNPLIQSGLTWESVQTVFTSGQASMWLPLTSISLMLDAELYGRDAGGYHVTNLLLHSANALLLFAAMWSMTGAVWKSGFVAALFAVHPLHVESVAWISERKDVLSLFFGLLAILAYSRYVRAPGWWWYLLTLLAFCMSLMAKPMLVTLPFLLLLFDVWPLGRTPLYQPADESPVANEDPKTTGLQTRTPPTSGTGRTWSRLVLEKVPLLALGIVCSVLTYLAEHRGGALPSTEAYPLDVRLANAVVVYVLYIGKMLWPTNLSVFYPHPGGSLSTATVIAAAAALTATSVMIFVSSRRRPYLAVGWLWYLGTLVPMIGLVQVGDYQMADRFTYFSIVGLFVLVAWLLPSSIPAKSAARSMLYVAAIAVIVALTLLARRQTALWSDSVTLLEHSIASTRPNAQLQNNLALAYEERGEFAAALEHYYAAMAVDGEYAPARLNLGALLQTQGRLIGAVEQFERVLSIDPNNATAHYNLGIARYQLGQFDQAAEQFEQTLSIDPHDSEARDWLARTRRRLKTPARRPARHSPSS